MINIVDIQVVRSFFVLALATRLWRGMPIFVQSPGCANYGNANASHQPQLLVLLSSFASRFYQALEETTNDYKNAYDEL